MRSGVQPMLPHKAWTEGVSDFNDSLFYLFYDPPSHKYRAKNCFPRVTFLFFLNVETCLAKTGPPR